MAWREEVTPKFHEWYLEMNRFIPTNINRLSLKDLEKAGVSRVLESRLTSKICLWLFKMKPEMIRKLDIADFRGKYSYQSQRLDIIE